MIDAAPSNTRGNVLAAAWGVVAGAGAVWPALLLAERITPLLDKRRALVVLPILLALPFYPAWIHRVRRGALGGALCAGIAWAIAASVVTIAIFRRTGDEYAGLAWNTIGYRQEMLQWIATGIGQEGDPSLYLPQHALHFAAFAAASLVSVGFLGLVLGAALLAYMNFYVAALFERAAAAGHATTIAAFGWPAYAMVRVVGYVTVGSALAAVALNVVGRAGISWRTVVRFLAVGLGLVVLDCVLKWRLAPWYRDVLSAAIAR